MKLKITQEHIDLANKSRENEEEDMTVYCPVGRALTDHFGTEMWAGVGVGGKNIPNYSHPDFFKVYFSNELQDVVEAFDRELPIVPGEYDFSLEDEY